LLLSIDMQSDIPIYTQIAQQVIEGIARGDLQRGEVLPSVRSLAGDLGVNLHTVNKAYHLLRQDGYVQINRKQGVMIESENMPKVDELFLSSFQDKLRPLIAEAICRGMDVMELQQLIKSGYGDFKPEIRKN